MNLIKLLIGILIFFLANCCSSIVLALTEPPVPKNTFNYKIESTSSNKIDLNINANEKHTIQINNPVKKIDGKLFDSDQEKIQKLFQKQKEMDIEDIKALWEATVERNSVIKFALKKLAIPPEQRRIHSSLMARSISTLISGVSILPSFLGADSITSSASAASGSLASRVISSKNMPKTMPLTDTELIQLAGLVEDLQDKLIKSYYDYKSSIDALIVCRQKILVQNKNYSQALHSGNELSIIITSSLYDKELTEELRLKQDIKLHRLELERLAGVKTVTDLNLTRIADLNFENENPSENLKKVSRLELRNE